MPEGSDLSANFGRTMRALCANRHLSSWSERLFAGIVDLQTLLSSRVRWRGKYFIKRIHWVIETDLSHQGEVNHNALSDAIDLYRIHEAYRMDVHG
ncbi:MAG: hypothetical protein ACLVJ6_01085 [Merdibacter sp.]